MWLAEADECGAKSIVDVAQLLVFGKFCQDLLIELCGFDAKQAGLSIGLQADCFEFGPGACAPICVVFFEEKFMDAHNSFVFFGEVAKGAKSCFSLGFGELFIECLQSRLCASEPCLQTGFEARGGAFCGDFPCRGATDWCTLCG